MYINDIQRNGTNMTKLSTGEARGLYEGLLYFSDKYRKTHLKFFNKVRKGEKRK